MRPILIVCIAMALLFSVQSCSVHEKGDEDSVISFSEFKARVYREPGEYGVYIVDGDIPIVDDEELKKFYDRNVARNADGGRLIVDNQEGEDTVWSNTDKMNITYCVNKGSFKGDYDRVVRAMEDAAASWEAVADVDFIHEVSQDSNCSRFNSKVKFDVTKKQWFDYGEYLARSFFPNFPRLLSNLIIDASSLELEADREPLTLTGILRHELGHILGLRHEHTRPESVHDDLWDPENGKCYEDYNWRPLTEYDPASVMHYPQCNGSGDWSLMLTQHDIEGIRLLYGPGGPVVPMVDITYPVDGQEVSGVLSVRTASASLQKVDFYVNDALVGTDSLDPYECSLDTNAYPDGSMLRIKAVALDSSGTTLSDEIAVTVNKSVFVCHSFRATNIEHVNAGRAESYRVLFLYYARTKGKGDSLGMMGTTLWSPTTTVCETASGYFIKGDCEWK